GMRSIPQPSLLFIGTAIVGAGIAMMNVLLPAVIKEKFPHKVGQMTSVYTTSMAIMASLASGLSVPLAMGAGLGWELALVSWGIVAIIGIAVWIVIINREPVSSENRYEESSQSASLAMLGMRARNAQQASTLSGMAQSIGYVFAAVGPLFIGLLFDLNDSWTVPLIAIIIVSVLMTLSGLGAGRDKYVTEE